MKKKKHCYPRTKIKFPLYENTKWKVGVNVQVMCMYVDNLELISTKKHADDVIKKRNSNTNNNNIFWRFVHSRHKR